MLENHTPEPPIADFTAEKPAMSRRDIGAVVVLR